jgi:hypothetical protein
MAADLRLSARGLGDWPGVMDFETLVPDIQSIAATKPSEVARFVWDTMSAESQTGGARGKIFVICLAVVLLREKITPFYVNCGVRGVPSHKWDFILAREDGSTVVISAHVAIRERWAHEHLAAWALKREINSSSEAYIVIENEIEAAQLRRRIDSGQVEFLDGSAQVFSEDFDKLVHGLRGQTFVDSPSIIDRGSAAKQLGFGPIDA